MGHALRSTLCPGEDTVARFLEGDLDADARTSVEAHLASCRHCTRLVGNAARAPSGGLESTLLAELVSPSPPLDPGTRVGRYVVRAPIGSGGMGRVYAAYDPTLDRQVALKLLHAGATQANLEARLLREAKTMARLAHHPEIVPVYDAGRHGAQLFIAMEFVEGGTLRAWLAARPRSWREIVGVFRTAGRGLAHAHAAGLVHRDFKPDNVLLGEDGRVRVSDFGLARVLREEGRASPSATEGARHAGGAVDASLTRTGTFVGTPAYMAPEQLRDGESDARSDIFSFCVTLYEALYGERPFRGDSVEELALATSRGRIAPSRTGRSVPRALDRVLHVGLRPNPDERYPSMSELLEALERATANRALTRPIVVSVLAAASVAASVAFVSSGRRTDAPRSTTAAMVEPPGGRAPASVAPPAPPPPAPASVPVANHAPAGPSGDAPSTSPEARPPARARPLASRPAPSAMARDAGAGGISIVEGRNGAPIMR